MKNVVFIISVTFLILNQCTSAFSNVHTARSLNSFNKAIQIAESGDSIVWENGTYDNIYMQINKDDIVVVAESPGKVIFSGKSKASLKGNRITFSGFQFLNGDIGTSSLLVSDGNNNQFSQINVKDYNCEKYLIINAQCERNVVLYCNFEHRMNNWDKNILSILVDANTPGYHLIRFCSFKNFDGTGGDMGVEPIRIGLSTQGDFISRSVVEYCYFTQCNGDSEIISNKSRQNVFRYNTFEDNPKAELVLRHGDEGVVYGNFFLKGMGGIRIKEGQHHVIYNNYFSGLTSRSMNLQNNSVDPLDSITIAFNTFHNSAKISLGGSGSYKPTNICLANNIFTANTGVLFDVPTGTEKWIGNISNGTLGITKPKGIRNENPKLEVNGKGFYGLSSECSAIDLALPGYPTLPNYEGLDIDHKIRHDIMQQIRPESINDKDVGCSEYPQNLIIKPHVTESNTGPSYLRDTLVSTYEFRNNIEQSFSLYPNPVINEITIAINQKQQGRVDLEPFDINGVKTDTLLNQYLELGTHLIKKDLSAHAAGTYFIRIYQDRQLSDSHPSPPQVLRFIKMMEL